MMINQLKLTLACILVFALNHVLCAQSQPLAIIPQPNHIEVKAGNFKLSANALQNLKGFKTQPATISQFAKQVLSQVKKGTSVDKNQKLDLSLQPSANIAQDGYHLSINNNGIQIISSNERGVFYGLQTLSQIITGAKDNALPFVEIKDEPRYKYRGLMLDVGRHFFPMEFIKAYIDVMAAYKLNYFHWHLTEDQGWRIEIKKYPKLASIASGRNGTLLNHLKDSVHIYDNTPYKGYYTQEEVKEIVRYAASRYITVIPEIELPGHSLAALSAYPEFGCGDNPGPYQAAMKWGIFDDVYCAGKESTFTFLQDILDEVMALFPATYIHIGGDECPKTKWKTCKYCQKRIKDNKLKDEHELQSYYVQRIEKYVNAKGRKIIGWDEILEGGLAPNATVMGWRGVKGGIAAATQGHEVIMVPSSHLYFDHREAVSDEEPLTISYGPTRHSSLKNVYSFNPSIDTLSADKQKFIIGVQANLWTEYIKTPAKAWYHLFPRIYGLAEIAWTKLEKKDWDSFSKIRVPQHLAIYDKTGEMYRVPEVIGIENKTYTGERFEFTLQPSVKGAKVYYTINGHSPSAVDQLYTETLKVTVPKGEERLLKCVVVTPSGKQSITTTARLVNQESKSI
jgi:hexosaminidase